MAMLLTIPAAQAQSPATQTTASAPAVETTDQAIAALSGRLERAPSATAVLEAWCAERGMAAEPRLVAEKVAGIVKPIDEVRRARLGIGPDEPVAYRRVRLACGSHVLSEADNWYVPGRLTPEMNAMLAATDTPFGRVVKPLSPSRRNLEIRRLWTGPASRTASPEEPLFSVTAILSTGAGVPFCEVVETYKGAVLARGLP